MVAKAGANLVPMAMPHNYVNMRLSNWNTFLKMYLRRSRNKTSKGWSLNILRNDIIASSCDILVQRLSISSVTSRQSGGITKVLRVCIRSVDFLMYDLICVT